VIFIRSQPPVDPVAMTMKILRDIVETKQQKTRYANRIIPFVLTCRSELSEIEQLAEKVLAPIFHQTQQSLRYAIQPKIRNCNRVDRDELIRTIAAKVGPNHTVDLKQPEYTILVEVFKVCVYLCVIDLN
jgi:tRNA acetyltransferase TAN1